MKVKDIVALAAENIGREDLAETLASLTEEPTGELKTLLRCYNLVENEVAIDYFPPKREESVLPVNGAVAFSSLSRIPVEICRVRNAEGEDVRFELHPSSLLLPEGTGAVTITYAYSPVNKGYADECEFQGKVSARLLSFGVAGEFCLTSARYSEAAIWQKRFQDALRAADYHKRRITVRARRWV